MNWLNAFLTSTVGRKFVMGVTGLFLCFFLVVHLAGNLMLYAGAEVYNEYAHKLHSNEEFLMIAETLLFAAFAAHIYLAFVLTWHNRSARLRSYAEKETKVEGRALNIFGYTPDNTMFLTGFIGLFFLIVHLNDFKFEGGWDFSEIDRASKAIVVVSTFSRQLIYLLGCVALGVHVSHGLGSAMQSIGFHHPKYTPCIWWCSKAFGVIVALGFGSFPVMAFIFDWASRVPQ